MAQIDPNWKRKTFRLSGIPQGFAKASDVASLLGQCLDGIGPKDVLVCSCAPTLNRWEEPPSNVATVMFRRTPSLLLTRKDQNRWTIDIPDEDDSLTLDSHFLGLTPLNHVPASDHVADCIAVSGLSSHPFGSWAAKGDDKRFMWIRDVASKSLRGVRHVIYGYDSDLGRTTSFQSLGDLARELVDQLGAAGWNLPGAKPVTFLAHSLGGIVVKDAIRQLANSDDVRGQSILSNIKALVLLGVPNLGMDESSFLTIVEGQPNEYLIEDLGRGSDYLCHLDEAFQGLCHTRRLSVFWGYETSKSPVTTREEDGTLVRGPAHAQLVTPLSATSRMINKHPERTFAISETHSELAKFSRDSMYLPVVMSKLEAAIGSAAETRPQQQALVRSLDDVVTDSTSKRKSSEVERVLASLHAPDLELRQEEINQNSEHTFEWTFEHESLTRWLQNGTGGFWIQGKPGSGKSTLMKFLFEDERTWQLINSRLDSLERVRAGFFFHYRGSSLQKSFDGLLRSVLWQLLDQQPRLIKHLEPVVPGLSERKPKLRARIPQDFWVISRLRQALHILLNQDETPLDVCFFFDALDEFDGPAEIIVDFIRHLVERERDSSVRVRVLFSSRPWPVFKTSFADWPGFPLHEHTGRDMLTYCANYISAQDHARQLISPLVPEIIEKANGSFLWVRLVLQNLWQEVKRETSPEGLRNVLRAIPAELSDFYASIIRRLSSSHRHETYALLELVVRQSGLLTPEYLVAAATCAPFSTYPALKECLWEFGLLHGRNVEQIIAKWSGGLVEISRRNSRDGEPYVQLLHQTVHDFVTSLGFKELVLGRLASLIDENGYSFHAKFLLAALDTDALELHYFHHLGKKPSDLDVASYARSSETTTGKSQKPFFDSITPEAYSGLARSRSSSVWTTALGFAAFFSLDLYILDTIASDSRCLRDSKENLFNCVASGLTSGPFSQEWPRTARLLLKNEYPLAMVSETITSFVTRYTASRTEDYALQLTKLALDYGYRPPEIIDYPTNPGFLHRDYYWSKKRPQIATCSLLHLPMPVAVAELLIDQGLDPNVLDSCGHTPLDTALMLHFSDYVTSPGELHNVYQLCALFIKHGGTVAQIDRAEVDSNIRAFEYYDYDTANIHECLSDSTGRANKLLPREDIIEIP